MMPEADGLSAMRCRYRDGCSCQMQLGCSRHQIRRLRVWTMDDGLRFTILFLVGEGGHWIHNRGVLELSLSPLNTATSVLSDGARWAAGVPRLRPPRAGIGWF